MTNEQKAQRLVILAAEMEHADNGAAALARPMVLQGIHCGHCGRLNRARGVGA